MAGFHCSISVNSCGPVDQTEGKASNLAVLIQQTKFRTTANNGRMSWICFVPLDHTRGNQGDEQTILGRAAN